MKISEVIVCEAKKAVAPVPSVLKQQQRVGKVMQQIAASDQQQQPNEMDKVMAMRRYADWQKQTDQIYRQRLKRLLILANMVENKTNN
jgi:hypothetical protein